MSEVTWCPSSSGFLWLHDRALPLVQQAAGSAEQADAAVLSSRLEVMAAQLERERAEHKRELRRSARQLQEVCAHLRPLASSSNGSVVLRPASGMLITECAVCARANSWMVALLGNVAQARGEVAAGWAAAAVHALRRAPAAALLPEWLRLLLPAAPLLQLQEELSRSRDVSRQLRLKLKACEQELSDAQEREQHLKAAAAAGPAPGSRRGSGRVGGPYQAASGWSKGSSYLGGGPGAAGSSRQYNKFPGKGSSRAAAGGSTAASSRG